MTYSNEELIGALVTSPTQKAAAEKVGCDKSTITRRMADPDFAELLATEKKNFLRAHLSGAVARAELATNALIDIIEHNPSDALRIRAADVLLKSL